MAHMDTSRLDRIGKRRSWVVGLVAVLLAALGGYWIAGQEWDRAAHEDRAEKAEQTADQLCDQIEEMGRTCVVRPSVQPERGEAGRGIAGVVAQGCSIRIRYTDATTEIVGPLCGADGSPGPRGSMGPSGPAGADGVSITSVEQDGCDLTVHFSDGTTTRTGPWCGPEGPTGPTGPAGPQGGPGRGIADAECVRNADGRWRWRIEYDDGTEDNDAGPCFQPRREQEPSPTPPPIRGN